MIAPVSLLLGLLALPAVTSAAGCIADDCLRALRATSRSADSGSFCTQYLKPSPTVVAPAYLSPCSSSTSRLSSACSCFLSTTASSPTATTTSSATSGPPDTTCPGAPVTSTITQSASTVTITQPPGAPVTSTITQSASTVTTTQPPVTVTITAVPTPTPMVSACDKSRNFLTNPGFETGDLSGWSSRIWYGEGEVQLESTNDHVAPSVGKYMWGGGPAQRGQVQKVTIPYLVNFDSLHAEIDVMLEAPNNSIEAECRVVIEIWDMDSYPVAWGWYHLPVGGGWRTVANDYTPDAIGLGGSDFTFVFSVDYCYTDDDLYYEARLYVDNAIFRANCKAECL